MRALGIVLFCFVLLSLTGCYGKAEIALPETTVLPSDTTTPVISELNVAGYTSETATIKWETDEETRGQIEYGITDTYGNMVADNGELSTSHSIELTMLQPNITYHFRVRSTDKSGNETVSGDNNFTNWAADKSWGKYTNDEYGFSILYPSTWGEYHGFTQTNAIQLARFDNVENTLFQGGVYPNDTPNPRLSEVKVKGVDILAFSADAPISTEWIQSSLSKAGYQPQNISTLIETTLPDGAKAYTCKATCNIIYTYYLYRIYSGLPTFCLVKDIGDSRICLVLFGQGQNYEEPLFSQIAHTLTFKNSGAPAAIQDTTQVPSLIPAPSELSFAAQTYTNEQYGFSIQYPDDWVARPELITEPGIQLSAFGVEGFVPGMLIYAFDTDAPESKDWIAESFKSTGCIVPMVSDINEETLADGTKAYTYIVGYFTKDTLCNFNSTAYNVESYVLDADRGGTRIRVNIFTIGFYEPYDWGLASEIVHTIRFTR